MDYNTQRNKLLLPEYGRCIQQMVGYALKIEDRRQRQACANTIVKLMAMFADKKDTGENLNIKLWNHLAEISDYKLDVDYPVAIKRKDEVEPLKNHLPYPQHKIQKYHYGHILETLTQKLMEIEHQDEKDELTRLVANQMKRSLANWNRDALNDEHVMDDLARYTDGQIQLDPARTPLISNERVLANAVQPATGKKKKKK